MAADADRPRYAGARRGDASPKVARYALSIRGRAARDIGVKRHLAVLIRYRMYRDPHVLRVEESNSPTRRRGPRGRQEIERRMTNV